jgi:hypothetical protein
MSVAASVFLFAFGALLALLTVVDVALTLLHLDLDGPVGTRVQAVTWWAMRALARTVPGRHRAVLAMAGPVMAAFTVATWSMTFFLGYALMILPLLPAGFLHTQGFHVAPSMRLALYISGTAGTTLGFGDLVPVDGLPRFLTVSEALLGLALLTCVLGYVVTLMQALAQRNLTVLTIHGETGSADDGVAFVARVLTDEDDVALVRRLDAITQALRVFYVHCHHYPLMHLYYRSHERAFDPEPAFRTALEAAIAGNVYGEREEGRRVRAAVMHLGGIMERLMHLMAQDYLGTPLDRKLDHGRPQAQDEELVEAVTARLEEVLPHEGPRMFGGQEAAIRLAYHGRLFLAALDRRTDWRRDHQRPADHVGLR